MKEIHVYNLLIITMGAFLVPIIASKIKIPTAVAEILYGILMGKSVFHLVKLDSKTVWISFLADFGFMILMFLAGLEINFSDLKKSGIKSLFLPIATFFITFFISIGFVLYFDLSSYMIFILTATGVGLLIPVLKELKIDKESIGKELFIFALIAELLTLIVFTFFEMFQLHGFSINLLQIPIMIFVAILFLKLMYLLSWWFPDKVAHWIHSEDSKESGLRMSFALMFVLVFFALLFHVELIIGAFIAGMVIAFTFKEREQLEKKISAMGYGFFIPIFFMNVGFNFHINSIMEKRTILLFFELLLLALIVKLLSSVVLVLRGISFRNSIASGFMFAAPLTLLVAFGMIGVRLKLITVEENNAIILLSMVGGIIYPILFKLIYKKG
ncbi:cation:proton antiporter [bacterium]|nr:cation:proton antiporter [bacterium]